MSQDRLISLNAAIDALRYAELGCELEAIKKLPPAQQWNPCSERLPKKPGQYYVSGGDKVWICEYLIISNSIGGWCNDVANPIVQAWMPLPTPYRPE